jgi:hypothetical protein
MIITLNSGSNQVSAGYSHVCCSGEPTLLKLQRLQASTYGPLPHFSSSRQSALNIRTTIALVKRNKTLRQMNGLPDEILIEIFRRHCSVLPAMSRITRAHELRHIGRRCFAVINVNLTYIIFGTHGAILHSFIKKIFSHPTEQNLFYILENFMDKPNCPAAIIEMYMSESTRIQLRIEADRIRQDEALKKLRGRCPIELSAWEKVKDDTERLRAITGGHPELQRFVAAVDGVKNTSDLQRVRHRIDFFVQAKGIVSLPFRESLIHFLPLIEH